MHRLCVALFCYILPVQLMAAELCVNLAFAEALVSQQQGTQATNQARGASSPLLRVPVSSLVRSPYSILDGEHRVDRERQALVITRNGEDAFLVINARRAFNLGVDEFLRRYVLSAGLNLNEEWILSVRQRFVGYELEELGVLGLAKLWNQTSELDLIDRLFFFAFLRFKARANEGR